MISTNCNCIAKRVLHLIIVRVRRRAWSVHVWMYDASREKAYCHTCILLLAKTSCSFRRSVWKFSYLWMYKLRRVQQRGHLQLLVGIHDPLGGISQGVVRVQGHVIWAHAWLDCIAQSINSTTYKMIVNFHAFESVCTSSSNFFRFVCFD